MMSSAATSSPVSASTLAYLMRWPVLRLIWLKETFSVSDVAGYRATGQVTSERRKKPFQLARGAMGKLRKRNRRGAKDTTAAGGFKHGGTGNLATALTVAGAKVPAVGRDLFARLGLNLPAAKDLNSARLRLEAMIAPGPPARPAGLGCRRQSIGIGPLRPDLTSGNAR